MAAQLDVEADHGAEDVDAVVGVAIALGYVRVGDVHVIHSGGNRIAGIEVVADSAAEVESEGERLSLCVVDADGAFGIDVANTEAHVKIGSDSRVARDKVAAHAHDVDEISGLGSARDCGHRSAELKVEISAEKPRASDVVHVPAERSDDRHQRVLERVGVVSVAGEKIEGQRDVDRKPSTVEREFEFVLVIDVAVEVGWFEGAGFLGWRG